MPIRGKILNCLKADYNKILKSDIITDLIKVLGCGVEIQTRNKELSSFDLNMLRWNKVVICTDGDVDGFQIRTLVLTMLYRLTPQLIEKGYVYIAETPLYEINTKGGKGSKKAPKTYFCLLYTSPVPSVPRCAGAPSTMPLWPKGAGWWLWAIILTMWWRPFCSPYFMKGVFTAFLR